jgi:hypothetical protein
MDTQNVSAQLYFKQLPVDPNATSVQSDAEIENAFQKQLNLASYYKTPGVFNEIKNKYIDKTIGYLQVPDTATPDVPVAQSIPANPWTSKSTFGSSKLSTLQIIGIILLILLVVVPGLLLIFKK